MPYNVKKDSFLCNRDFSRPGCCWYKCDDRDDNICPGCYSCYNNCPHDVYEIVNNEPYPVNQKNVLDVESAKKCVQTMPSMYMQ